MVAGSYGPYGAFTTYRPPWEGFFIPPAMRVVADFSHFTSYKALCSWQYGVIPVTMEFIFFDPHSGEFLI